jgi:PAS domain S-box-containing protein
MNISPQLQKEDERIKALYQLQILDTDAETDFNDIVTLASQICETPISMIAFFDNERSWFKAKLGVDFCEFPKGASFFAPDLCNDDLTIIEDTLQDYRLKNNPEVKSKPGIRFYAGIPIINEDGFKLGHLCVLDYKPRTLSNAQCSGLRILARQVATLLKLRLQLLKSNNNQSAAISSGEQMATIFHNAIDAVIVMNTNGLIVEWNPKAEIIFGWLASDAIGRPFHELIVPERFRESHLLRMKHYEDEYPTDEIDETIEITALCKNKQEIDIELGISPNTIKGQRFFICFLSNITERKLVLRELDKQKKFYENILNKLPADIVVFDAQHKYIFVNPLAIKNEELRKYIIGKDDFEYAEYRGRDTSIAELRREQFLEIKNSAKEIRWEDSLTDPDGNTITHLRRLFPVFDDNGELLMVLGFGVDITDRKKQLALVNQLSSQNTQLIDFCNIVSHNLRAPLVNMSMLVSYILESKDQEEQQFMLGKLNPVIDNLHQTFNELVESIQIKQDIEVQSEHINLKDCLDKTITALEMEIKKSNAVIEINFEDAPQIYYPSKYANSIFLNVVSNALKYQSPKRSPFIKLATKKVNGNILFSINDNGLGVNLEKHKDNFFKIGKVFHRHPNAKGFGLFMTKTQVEAMGGKIWLESTPDVGTTFFIEFINQTTI